MFIVSATIYLFTKLLFTFFLGVLILLQKSNQIKPMTNLMLKAKHLALKMTLVPSQILPHCMFCFIFWYIKYLFTKFCLLFFLRYGAPPGDALDEYGNGADYSDYDENDYTVSQRCLQKKCNFLGGWGFLLNNPH